MEHSVNFISLNFVIKLKEDLFITKLKEDLIITKLKDY